MENKQTDFSDTKIEPSIPRGVAIIQYWLIQLRNFLQDKTSNSVTENRNLFKSIFGDDGKHLYSKDWENDFGGFFLNLDTKNQIALLNFISALQIDLTLPEIPEWEKIAEKFGMQDWPEYDEEDVRSMAVGFRELSEWDCYPHELVWLRKFILYALNHSIDDDAYEGEKFGNLDNWTKFYSEKLSNPQKLELCEGLIKYA